MKRHPIGRPLRVAVLLCTLSACAPPPTVDTPGLNAAVYARRPPPAGRPSYAATIKYIDDGMRYLDPAAGFFVAPDGRMCFRGSLSIKETVFDYMYNSDWCLAPTAIGQVDALGTLTTDQLRLSCRHADPQCIREIGNFNRQADSITLTNVPPRAEKAAVEYLVYLMDGYVGDSQPF